MKKTFLIICAIMVNCLWAQKPVLKTNSTLNNTITKPTTVNSTVLKTNPGVISTNLIKGTPFVLKRIIPMSGSVSKFKMIKGNGVTNENKGTPTKEKDEEGRFCTITKIDASKGYDEQLVLGNQNDKIYPGAIYYDNAFIDGTYNAPQQLPLKPYNINTNLFASSSRGSSRIEVEASQGKVYDGIAELMRRNSSVINAAMTGFEVKQVSSTDQLAFEIGAGFQGYNVDLNANFNYLSQKRKNVYFAKLVQVYFTINAEVNGQDNLLSAPFNTSNLVYVNKVNYGRIAIVQVSSDYSREEVNAALDFAYNNGSIGANANLELNYKKISESSEIKGLFFGGDASNSIPVTSFDQIKGFSNYVRNGLLWNPNIAPTPVSYQLKYLNDNSVASTQATTSFTQRNCVSASAIKIKLHGIAIDDTDNTCGCAWGNINVKVWETDAEGRPIKQILPFGETDFGTTYYWNAPLNSTPVRVLKYSELKEKEIDFRGNVDRLNGINIEKTYKIDPEKYAANRVLVEFTMKTTTDHKDNDFASRGFPEMPETQTRKVLLSDLILADNSSSATAIEKKNYTYKLGGFESNSDRRKIFYAMFSITPAK